MMLSISKTVLIYLMPQSDLTLSVKCGLIKYLIIYEKIRCSQFQTLVNKIEKTSLLDSNVAFCLERNIHIISIQLFVVLHRLT